MGEWQIQNEMRRRGRKAIVDKMKWKNATGKAVEDVHDSKRHSNCREEDEEPRGAAGM